MKLILCAIFLGLALGKDRRDEFNEKVKKFAVEDGINLKAESADVMKERYIQYCEDADRVDKINADESLPYTAETNALSIKTPSERAASLGFNASGIHDSGNDIEEAPMTSNSVSATAASRDFRTKACPPIKNQGSCGSCWTFAAASSLESEVYFVTGKLHNMAEQEYLVCSSSYGGSSHDGCNGGWMEWCYKYNMAKGRMGYTKNIAYKAKDDFNCNNNNNGGNALADSNVEVTANVKVQGDANLLTAAASHVVSVAIYVGGTFMSYKSGVYVDSTCNSKNANHAVSVAGYGTLGSYNYWLVRNSWGTSWGDKGYIKMDRNKQNMCHISTYSHYPKVTCKSSSCKAVKPDDADGSGGEGDDEGDDEGEEDDSDGDDNFIPCKFGKKTKGTLIKGSKIGDCQDSLADAKKVCEANKSTCVGVNKGKKKCFYAVSAKATKTKKTKTKFYAIKFECSEEEEEEEEDDNDGCPSGTMMCDDGVCKHEHMC